MNYKGYEIIQRNGHYVVIEPDGTELSEEDTIRDARETIDEQIKE